MAVSLFDLVLFQMLLGGMALGMFRGVVRQVLSVAILYAGVILAAYSYGWAASWIGSAVNKPGALANSAAFVMLLVILVAGFESLIHNSYPDLEWKALGGLNQLGGMLAGFLWAGLCTLFVLMALTFALNSGSWGPIEGVRRTLSLAADRSVLAAIYRDTFPLFIRTLAPWFPGGLPPLLNQSFPL